MPIPVSAGAKVALSFQMRKAFPEIKSAHMAFSSRKSIIFAIAGTTREQETQQDIMGIGFNLKTTCKSVQSFQQALDNAFKPFGYDIKHQPKASIISWHSDFSGSFQFVYEKRKGLLNNSYSVSGYCQTNIYGPGFHKAITEIVDQLIENHDSAIEIEDETNYFDTRDFAQLHRYFCQWLRNIFMAIQEKPNAYLCWPMQQYQPKEQPDMAITPFGRFSITEISERIKHEGIETFAEEFFIWHDIEKNARLYYKLALHLLWTNCYFMDSDRSDTDASINHFIIYCLEQAATLNPRQPFPKQLYLEICALHKHQPIYIEHLTDYVPSFPIGYRREWLGYHIGNLTCYFPGNHLKGTDGNATVFFDLKKEHWHSVRCVAYPYTKGNPEFASLNAPIVEEGILNNGAYRLSNMGFEAPSSNDDNPYPVYTCQILSPSQFTLLTICAETEKELHDYAIQIVKQIRIG